MTLLLLGCFLFALHIEFPHLAFRLYSLFSNFFIDVLVQVILLSIPISSPLQHVLYINLQTY